MNKVQCFKIKKGTDFYKAVQEHFALLPRWEEVFPKVSELLGEKITKLAFYKENLRVDLREISNPENKMLFKEDGWLKKNSKSANELRQAYKKIIHEVGLTDYEELSHTNFTYGVMRMRHQELESFKTSENEIYYKADFDLEKSSKGMVEPISEIEYQEKYLEEIKKRKTTK